MSYAGPFQPAVRPVVSRLYCPVAACAVLAETVARRDPSVVPVSKPLARTTGSSAWAGTAVVPRTAAVASAASAASFRDLRRIFEPP